MVNTASSTDSVVHLGTAGDYAILAKTGISTVPDSAIVGDIAVSPITGAAMTGFTFTLDTSTTFSRSAQITTGRAYAADYTAPTPSKLTTAVSDMETAYTEAAGLPTSWGHFDNNVATICGTNDPGCTPFLNLGGGEIGSLTLVPGVYTFDRQVNINNDVTFDGAGIFIIQTTGSVKQAASTSLNPINGALAKNIFWQVAGEVIVGATAHMEGVILAKTAVVFQTGSSLNGRILAQTAVTLQSATINQPPTQAPTQAPTTASPASF